MRSVFPKIMQIFQVLIEMVIKSHYTTINFFYWWIFFAKKSVIDDCFRFRLFVWALFCDKEAMVAVLEGTHELQTDHVKCLKSVYNYFLT